MWKKKLNFRAKNKNQLIDGAPWRPTFVNKNCPKSKNKLFRPKNYSKIPTGSKVITVLRYGLKIHPQNENFKKSS